MIPGDVFMMGVAGQRVASCLREKIPVFWDMRTLGRPSGTPEYLNW